MKDFDAQHQTDEPEHHASPENERQAGVRAVYDNVMQRFDSRLSVGAVVVGVGLMVLMGALATSYFAGARIPDDEYAKSSAMVQQLSKHADELTVHSKRVRESMATGVQGQKSLDSAKTAANSYMNLLLQLQDSPVIKDDKDVKAVYDANKQRIEEYGSENTLVLQAIDIYSGLVKTCNEFKEKAKTAQSAKEFDTYITKCRDYAKNHKTVPLKEFNATVYVPYRKAVLEFATATRSNFIAVRSGSRSSAQSALIRMNKAETAMQKASASGDQTLGSIQSAGDQLSMLREIIEERKGD